MATQYTPALKLALPVTGELSGTWGDVVNDNITSMIEQAVAGIATINTWTSNVHTLTEANGTTSEARCAALVAVNGAGLTAAGQIICPASTKLYVLINNTSYAITLKTSGGTGIAVPTGGASLLVCDGTNVVVGIRDITGNAATATTATNATNVALTTSSTASAFKVAFANTTASTTGNYGLLQDDTATFTYNPSTNTLVVGTASTTNLVIGGKYTENVFTITDGASVDLNPANGTIQVWTLGASRSPTASSFGAGESMTLMVNDGTAYTITWPSVTWVNNAGAAPTLNLTGFTTIALWKVSTTLYGALVGNGT